MAKPCFVRPQQKPMNPLERSLIEKAGYTNGWENVRESTPERVVMFSTRHKAEAEQRPCQSSAEPPA